jgi:hypothetical protein
MIIATGTPDTGDGAAVRNASAITADHAATMMMTAITAGDVGMDMEMAAVMAEDMDVIATAIGTTINALQ